ncbi:uncharacterized protein RCC_06478 [Ramularia collo-cygni]|uniref:Uncharacterized protein n=1 Tax=Ramularia collo-cygni TaxID=112498 RepID=A0A2D3V592_9PEZI|nr:uncharacterized protein RCC_06478 [Ramularia collo-cygni]CZT20620.1 uncharacterized protein RCC_06478 [Ramularia collo-cygni]
MARRIIHHQHLSIGCLSCVLGVQQAMKARVLAAHPEVVVKELPYQPGIEFALPHGTANPIVNDDPAWRDVELDARKINGTKEVKKARGAGVSTETNGPRSEHVR